jgi:hypothetical protein
MVVTWIAAALVIALGAFTVYRLVRSWRAARGDLETFDPPRSDPA